MKVEELYGILRDCHLCPRDCGADRISGESGACRYGPSAVVYSYGLHPGEEPPVSGTGGSGTIFFSGCPLRCVYCQNYRFSQGREGTIVPPSKLADMMLTMQGKGAHNINLVTPTHFLRAIIEALIIAIGKGLKIPLVYNTVGYESPKTLSLLNGVVDIYLADMRYGEDRFGQKFSNITDYASVNKVAIKRMHEQVGDLVIDDDGIAVNGLIVRHLILPNGLAGTGKTFKFLADEVSSDTYISLMAQYRPLNKAKRYPELARPITEEEYDAAKTMMEEAGLQNGWIQEFSNPGEGSLYEGPKIKPNTEGSPDLW